MYGLLNLVKRLNDHLKFPGIDNNLAININYCKTCNIKINASLFPLLRQRDEYQEVQTVLTFADGRFHV